MVERRDLGKPECCDEAENMHQAVRDKKRGDTETDHRSAPSDRPVDLHLPQQCNGRIVSNSAKGPDARSGIDILGTDADRSSNRRKAVGWYET